MKKWMVVCFLLMSFFSDAQYRVVFKITGLPAYHAAGSKVYIAGSFNNWNPANDAFLLKENTITLSLPRGVHEYKFTRGNWATGEALANGGSITNRQLVVEKDTAINVDIAAWADHFDTQKKVSTANKNVHIIDTAFYMPQLKRYRRIWICLPESYTTSHKKYPVLYLHDGQNVFDAATGFAGEWGVDEAMDTLNKVTTESIIVAIDNGGDKRMNEYSPYDMEKYGKGEGDLYVDFLVKTLKPFINKHYRTKKCYRHQYVAGSSMGGLISLYAILKYPKAFGGAGVFSPAFWIAPGIKNAIAANAKKVKGKIYFYAGKDESESMVQDMISVFTQMSNLSNAKMTTVIRAAGKHNEATWRQEFPLFYKWLFAAAH